jgi:hypothetical protein
MPRKKAAIAEAIGPHETRNALAVLTYAHEAMMTLDKLSPPALEAYTLALISLRPGPVEALVFHGAFAALAHPLNAYG